MWNMSALRLGSQRGGCAGGLVDARIAAVLGIVLVAVGAWLVLEASAIGRAEGFWRALSQSPSG